MVQSKYALEVIKRELRRKELGGRHGAEGEI